MYGYVKVSGIPRRLGRNAVVFFYSKNLTTGQNQIVGIYGNVEILEPSRHTRWAGFKEGSLESNFRTEKTLSMLFPIPLDSDKYAHGKRLVPQAGLTYIPLGLARRIISDELTHLTTSNITERERDKEPKQTLKEAPVERRPPEFQTALSTSYMVKAWAQTLAESLTLLKGVPVTSSLKGAAELAEPSPTEQFYTISAMAHAEIISEPMEV